MASTNPNEPPPAYDHVAGRSSTSNHAAGTSANLSVPEENDVQAARKSMEDMVRPLPKGWIRQWDPASHHNFFVDTLANSPRSIWCHPHDDPEYQNAHPDEINRERERIQHESLVHADTDEDEDDAFVAANSGGAKGGHGKASTAGGATSGSSAPPKGVKKFGRSLKDKMTNTTHEEREAKRKAEKEAEQRALERHRAIRQLLIKATQTGQPQLVGRDKQGRDIYAQPPPPGAYGYGASLGYSPYQTMNGPYGGAGPYSAPMGPYRRGGGMMGGGMGMGMPLLGGMMLGGLLF